MEYRWFVQGWRWLTIPYSSRQQVMDCLFRCGLTFRDQRIHPDGSVTVKLRRRDAAVLEKYGGELEYSLSEEHGLPVLVRFLRFRCGLLLGFVMMAVWLFYSSRLIWDVRVTGNTETPTEEIVSLLEELGCGVGDYYPGISFNDVHAWYLAMQDDISWLSVYMNGTVAEVQVREMRKDERHLPEKGVCADVVAEQYGVVEEVHVISGTAAVKAGDTVVPGQILISGITELKEGELLYEYAEGEVICRTFSVIRAEVPAEREAKRYTGREKTDFSIKFFKKSLNLFRKGGIDAATCDTINMMEQVCPFGMNPLPVWIYRTVYREYELVTETIPADDAAAEAMLELSGKIKDETEGAELVSREVTEEFEDGICRITCLLYLRRDNGRTEEFRP
ncbi:MAG: sporulation protein YqfD [Clostridia bacterium]|nr:sporulation protein YqfD [Clostridia bacterium]